MKILITGGAGFIGSNLALELEKQGHEVTIIDNLFSGDIDNIKTFGGVFIDEDVCDFKTEEEFDVIFHLASITDPRHPDDAETYDKNISGFKNMITLAEKTGAKLIYASTGGLYGNGKTPMQENQEKEILNTYGKSKLEMDKMAEELFDKMDIIGLRYFNVFGPGESFKGKSASMIYHLAKQIKEGKNPRIFNKGEQARDHIYVKDVVSATIKAMDLEGTCVNPICECRHSAVNHHKRYMPVRYYKCKKCPCKKFTPNKKSCIVNVGTGTATTFNELVKILNEVMGTSLLPEYIDMPYDPKTYQSNTQADTRKAEELIGFRSKWTLKEGIKDYIKFLDNSK